MPIWHNFLAAAAAADCSLLSTTTLLPPPDASSSTLKTWASANAPIIAQAKAHCHAHDSALRSARFKQARNDLNAIYLDAITGSGRLSPFLKRVMHPIHRVLKHTQIDTLAGGASTVPSVIKARIASHVYDWHRVRRSAPPAPGSGSTPQINHDFATVASLYDEANHATPIPSITDLISTDSFLKTARSVSPHSCPGDSGISAKLLTYCPPAAITALTDLSNLCLRWAALPNQYDCAMLMLIPKPGAQTFSNSRPISLLEAPLKVVTRIVNNRLTHALLDAAYFSAVQFGFLPGRGCSDPFHALLSCIEDAKSRNLPLHLCLVDLEKAFDSLERWSLQKSYQRAGINAHDVQFLLALDGTGSAKIITPFGLTKPTKVKRGVRQGECLSSTKFIIWLEPWLQHIAATYPEIGYTLPDGTRILLLCFADDVAILTSNHEDMQTIMTSLCAFLSYHGVTISQTKTVYTSRSTIRLPLTARIFSRDSTPANIYHRTVDIEHHPANKVIKYLGGGLSLDLDWANIFASTDSAITMDLKRLANRRLTLQQAMLVANTVIRGRAGFFLQLAPFPRDMVKKWDVQLDRLLKLKGNLPYTSSPAVLHSPKSKGGIELFSFAAIAQASSVTGLLARLNNPTFVGSAARTRWHHMQNIINPYPSQAPSDSLTMHCCNRAKSIGYTIFQNKPVPECPGVDPLTSTNTPNTIANLRMVAATETMLSTILPLSDSDLLSTLESLGLHHLSQIATPNGSIRAWNEFSNRREPAQWYQRLANLPRFRIFPHPIQAQDLIKIQPPPLPSTDAPDYTPRLIRQRPDSAQRSFDSPPTPPTTLPQLIFFTDGSIKNRRGCPHGGHGSVTLYDVPGWAQSTVRIRRPGQPSYTLKVGRRLAAHLTLGDEPISVDTMELRTLLDIAENAPAIDIVVFVDPTYITKNLPNMRKLTTLRWTRFSNRHLWKRLIAAIDRREADGFTLKVIKCAAHDKDPTQHPHISLGNYVADLAAKEAASFCSPHTDWLPDDHTHFSLAFNNKLVRGDPRRHIRRTIASRSLHHLVTLPVEGASTQRALEGQLHAPTLADIRNPLKWAKSARQSIYPFALALQGRALSNTPSKTFRSRKNELAQQLTLVPTTPIPAESAHALTPTQLIPTVHPIGKAAPNPRNANANRHTGPSTTDPSALSAPNPRI